MRQRTASARRDSVAVIDIGSNSGRVMVFRARRLEPSAPARRIARFPAARARCRHAPAAQRSDDVAHAGGAA